MFKFLIALFLPHCPKQYHRTVRYTFSFMFLTLVFTGLAAVVTHDQSYITVTTSAETVVQEQQFFIDVKAFAHIPINAVDVTVSYPSDVMAIDAIDTGTSVITLWAKEPYAKDGNIYLQGGTFRKGFMGEHTVARIRAHAIAPGEARVVVKDTEFIAGDGKGTVVETDAHAYKSVQIVVTGTNGVLTAKADVSIVTDCDGDGDVDIGDVTKFMSAWLTKGSTYDFDSDGRMTFRDFSILLADSFLN